MLNRYFYIINGISHGTAMVSHEIDTDTMEGMRNADMVSVFLSVASGKRRGLKTGWLSHHLDLIAGISAATL